MLRRALFKPFSAAMRWLVGTPLARVIWLIPGSRALYRSLIGMRPSSVVIDGHTINLDETDSLLLSVNGEYEAVESRLFRECLRPRATVLDVGGHIGYYTLQAARGVGGEGQVFTFEPAPENFALLQKNIAQNDYKNVVAVNCAVSDRAGEQLLFISRDNTGDHRLGDSEAGEGSVAVETITLDDYFGPEFPAIDVIKMDIQGSEPKALAGAHNLLQSNDDVVLFTELSPEHLGSAAAGEMVRTLVGEGFVLNEVDEDSGAVSRIEPDELIARIRKGETAGFTNLLCAKGPRANQQVEQLAGVISA